MKTCARQGIENWHANCCCFLYGVTYVNVLAFFMQNSFLFPNRKICPLNLL